LSEVDILIMTSLHESVGTLLGRNMLTSSVDSLCANVFDCAFQRITLMRG